MWLERRDRETDLTPTVYYDEKKRVMFSHAQIKKVQRAKVKMFHPQLETNAP